MKYVTLIAISSFALLTTVSCGPTIGDKQVPNPPQLDKGAIAKVGSDPNASIGERKGQINTLHPVRPQ